jgi:GAF domain-containing protein
MRRRARFGTRIAKAKRRKAKRRSIAPRSHANLRERLDRSRRELKEALEHQTATSEVLDLISRTPTNVQPVFDAIIESTVRLCDAVFGVVWRYDGELLHYAASHNFTPDVLDQISKIYPKRPDRSIAAGRAILDGRIAHVPDMLTDREYAHELALAGNWRASLAVPMLHKGKPVGSISIGKAETGPFSKRQIQLLTTFAAQAVIAIENARLLNELRQSLEQQTATSEVLKVISSSPGELEPVFQALLENATRICEAKFGTLFQYDGKLLHRVAGIGTPPALVEFQEKRGPFKPETSLRLNRLLQTKAVCHTADELGELEPGPPAKYGGARSVLGVPMVKDEEFVGAIVIYRQEVRPFTHKQIELVQNFAAEAVIAIENARLLNELRQRTTDLTESLEQQTATSKVLEVISSSPGDLKPVFEAILKNAVRLCGAKFGNLYLREGDGVRAVAIHNAPAAFAEQRAGVMQPSQHSTIWQAIQTKQAAQNADMTKSQAYVRGDPWLVSTVSLGGFRSVLSVPMLHEDESIGGITIFRQDPGTFAAKQIELLTNFAKQAVIAIENTRLLNELRESLDQQTATADVLRVISSSPSELESVFHAILGNATRLCEAKFGNLWLSEGDTFVIAGTHGAPPEYREFLETEPVVADPEPESAMGRVARTHEVVQIEDITKQPAQGSTAPMRFATIELAKARTLVGVPMLRDDELVGIIAIYRQEVRPFTEKQIELLTNFAAQAVIAIENTRLLNELRQSLQQQTATADVLKVISRSTFDLQTVLSTLAESAGQLCEADIASIHRQQGSNYQTMAIYGGPPEQKDEQKELVLRTVPFTAGRGSVVGRTVAERRPIQISDVLADPDYSLLDVQRKVGFRTIMGVPILREGYPSGVIVLMRLTVRPFTEKQIELATTFADQAGIAIENVRLFDEIQDKSRQLEVASQHKSQFLANMSHELRTPLNAILGYTELMADGAYGEPSEKMLGVLKRLETNGRHLLGLINDVLDLSKIEAGQLVLELSDYFIQDIAQTVRSTLEPLATDKKLGFKVEVASQLPSGRGDGRRLTQVLINLVGNAIKFTDAGEVAIRAETNNGSFFVSVRDTGPGISAADQARLFQEFQQADNAITRKKGGTGLGLAISKRIIEMHGGRIWVESRPGQGSTFAFTLPVVVERQVEGV